MGNRSSYGQLSRSLTISSAYTIEYNAEEGENTDSVKTNGTLVYENKLANNAPANTYDAETGLLYNKDKTEVYKPGEWDYDGIFEVPETLAELPRLSEASSVCLKVWTELKISDEGCSNNLREWTGDPAGYREELDMPLLKGVIVPEKFTEIPNNFLYCHSGEIGRAHV